MTKPVTPQEMFDLFEGSYAGRLAGIKLDPTSAETVRTRNLEFFGKLVQFGYANGIDMRITWSPVHARTLALR